jgi:hypothetical protein
LPDGVVVTEVIELLMLLLLIPAAGTAGTGKDRVGRARDWIRESTDAKPTSDGSIFVIVLKLNKWVKVK